MIAAGLGSAIGGMGSAIGSGIGGVQRKLSEKKEARRSSSELAKQVTQREKQNKAAVQAQAEAWQVAQAAKASIQGTLVKPKSYVPKPANAERMHTSVQLVYKRGRRRGRGERECVWTKRSSLLRNVQVRARKKGLRRCVCASAY